MAKDEPTFASRSVPFDMTGVIPLGTQQDELLASFSAAEFPRKARPLVCHVNVKSLNTSGLLELPAGGSFDDWPPEDPPNTPADVDSGFLIFEYGDGSASRRIMTDLKSGTYQLPPSIEARVFANVYTNNTLPFLHQCQVSACLSEGWMSNPTRPVYSWMQPIGAGSSWSSFIPDGARWVQVMLGTQEVPGSGTNVLRFVGGGASIYMDWAGNVFVPPVQPVELGPRYSEDTWGLFNDGADNITYGTAVRFFLEF